MKPERVDLGVQPGWTAPSRNRLPPHGPPLTSRPASGLNPQVSQSQGQGLPLQCHQEILFSPDIFSRSRAPSKCHVSRLLLHGNFGLFKEMVIMLLPP